MSFFLLTKRERIGAVAFVLILFLISVFKVNQLSSFEDEVIIYSSKEKTDQKNDINLGEESYSKREFVSDQKEKKKTKLYLSQKINPNLLNKEDWIRIGFSQVMSTRLEKFCKNGPGIRKKEDLLKVYGLDAFLFEQIEPYLMIEQNKIDLNTDKLSEVLKIKGVGQVLGSRIIKYGELLGGYVKKEQLKEVYGVSDDIYNQIKNQIKVDSISVKKVSLNKAAYNELVAHPYIDKDLAKKIIEARGDAYISISNLEELTDSLIFYKLQAYVQF